MLNPGYRAMVRVHKMAKDAGPEIRCPSCKKVIMEAMADRIKTRCKHCGKWIFLEKVDK